MVFALSRFRDAVLLRGLRRAFNDNNFRSNMATAATDAGTNRLIHERSPYLLQHARNPVDWYPWGDEAIQKAKQTNRPIFLSVGYSTCHWCHVMEHESFENPSIAAILNEHFVSIKVDREERPDVDRLYMSFIQAISGGGGWPMSVFLTPELEPITGGTYFPPNDSYGRPGFASVLRMIAEKWRSEGEMVRGQGKALLGAMRRALLSESGDVASSDRAATACLKHLSGTFDDVHKGFGEAPKFPKPVDLDFLLHFHTRNPSSGEGKHALRMAGETLHAMARGGIHDHVGKGFHRYSVDSSWHVPHFEKMLYDQAQLLAVYANYFQLTGECRETVEDIAAYVHQCLTHKDGGFYSAEDADSLPTKDASKKREGAFCVWTEAEIDDALRDLKVDGCGDLCAVDIFKKYFFVKPDGNAPPYTDPHDELKNQNILIMKDTHENFAKQFGVSTEDLSKVIQAGKTALANVRAGRPKPHLDDKMLTSWNGLMISGLARASIALRDSEYVSRAQRAVHFVETHLRTQDGGLLRAAYTANTGDVVLTSQPIKAFADDYAFYIQGLLDLYEATHDETLLKTATELQAELDRRFWDTEKNTGYFLSENDPAIMIRMMEDQDGAEPCVNSVAAWNLLRLSDIFGGTSYREKADRIFKGAALRLDKYAFILPKMVTALAKRAEPSKQIVVVGDVSDPETKGLIQEISGRVIPDKCFIVLDRSKESWLSSRSEHLTALYAIEEIPKVFVCENFACSLPVSSLDDLKNRLDNLSLKQI